MKSVNSSRSVLIPGAAIFIIAVTSYLWSMARSEQCPAASNPTSSLSAKGVELSIEVASDEASRSCGLAFRDRLPEGHGMLFVYKEERILEFWMKNTRIPLALAYIGSDRKIREILHMEPDKEGRVYRSHEPVQYALETNPGWFASNGISVGDPVRFSLPGERNIN